MNLKNSIACLLRKPAQFIKRYSDEELIASCDWIEDLYHLCIKFRMVFNNYPIELFLSPYTEQLIRIFADQNIKKAVLDSWNHKFDESTDDIKLFITKLIFLTNSIEDRNSKKIMDFAFKTANADYRYWTAMDISMFTFLATNGFYQEYYTDRRELLHRIIEERCVKAPIIQKRDSSDRICIITFMLKSHAQSSVQRVVNMIANAMAERANEVMILSLESFYTSTHEGVRINTARRKTSARLSVSKVKKMINPKVSVLYARGKSIDQRMQDAINIIYRYNPTCILDVSDEFSALSEIYSKDFNTIYIPLRISGSSLSYTKIVGTDWMYDRSNKQFNSIDMSQVVNWNLPEYVPHDGEKILRRDIGVRDDSFVIVSVGYNTSGFSREYIDQLCSLLNKHKNFCWLLVGENGSPYLHKNYQSLFYNGQIIEHGYEKNLTGLYKSCDILLRSDTTGSSGATAIAAMQGIPIVMSDYECDPMRWLGKDYSNLKTPSEIMREIERLFYDKSYYATKRHQVKELVAHAIDEDFWWDKLFELSTDHGTR